MDDALATSGERFARAILALRRSSQNRAMQRAIYSVGDFELTPVQVDILEIVVGHGEARMADIARNLGVDPSTASRTIQPLFTLGLVERREDVSDRRSRVIVPTSAGRRQADQIVAFRSAAMRSVLRRFTPERLALLADLIEEYVAALDEYDFVKRE